MKKLLLTTTLTLSSLMVSVSAQADDLFIGQVITTAANFCPRNTAELDGQLLSINDNQALFSLLGTTYGGDGRTTFAVPDMRGRSPVHSGTGKGLTRIYLGRKGGKESRATGTSGQKNNGNTAAQGGYQAMAPRSPYLALKMCLVTRGMFPSRS